jgi:hypothetical protein
MINWNLWYLKGLKNIVAWNKTIEIGKTENKNQKKFKNLTIHCKNKMQIELCEKNNSEDI